VTAFWPALMAVPCLLVVGLSKERSAEIRVDPPQNAEPTAMANPVEEASGAAAQSLQDLEGAAHVPDGIIITVSKGAEQKTDDAAEQDEQEEAASSEQGVLDVAAGGDAATGDGEADFHDARADVASSSALDGTKDQHEDTQGTTAATNP
jgi:hypothetical protein